jgi:hypothetical protein
MSAWGGLRTFTGYDRAVTTSGDILVFRPRPAHWLPLLIPMAFPIALGFMNLVEGAIAYGLVAFAFAAATIGYNGTTRLTIADDISFSRYGRKLWQVRADGAEVRSGRTGELPVLPAFVVSDQRGASGSFPKSMLTAADAAKVRAAVELRGGRWAL